MSGRRRVSSLLLPVVAAGLLLGCARLLPTPREALTEDARRALALLITRWHEVRDLRGLADIEFQRGSERQRLAGVVLAKAPASLRFEALSPFGTPLLLLVIHDGRFVAYDATKNEAAVGEASSETTARLLSLPVEPDELVAVLAGRVVPPKDVRAAEVLPADEHGPSLLIFGGATRQRVWMDLDTGLVRQLLITGGRAEARISFLREADGRLTGLDVSAGEAYVTASLRYRRLETDIGLAGERFVFTPPKGAKIQGIQPPKR